MLCAVYRSSKKADTYLYLKQRDDFSEVPKALLEVFGRPTFVMLVPTAKRERIANMDKTAFLKKLDEQGYYLQMPPKQENLLEQLRTAQGLSPDHKK